MTPWFKKRKLHMVAIVTAFGLVVAVIVPTEHKGEAAQRASSSTYTQSTQVEDSSVDNSLVADTLIGDASLEASQSIAAKSSLGTFGLATENSVASAETDTTEETSDIFSLAGSEETLEAAEVVVTEETATEETTEEVTEEGTKEAAKEEDEEPAPEFYTVGMNHSSVAEIQQRLMDLGFMDYAEPTQLYGAITAEAVMLFQRQNELNQDGIIGPETKGMLLSEDAKKYTAKLGMSGNDISRIQTRLYEMGYLASSNEITGTFDETTEDAVIKMQEVNGISADGKVGLVTAELLYSGEAKANLISYGDKSDIILQSQQRLKDLGYLNTRPDGMYGSDTEAAVKEFQSKNDLVVDGYLGPSTREALNSSSAVGYGVMLGDSGESVEHVQEYLIKYGYLSADNATGYFGDVTEAAVKAFQRNNGLTVDGYVGINTKNKLINADVVKASSNSGSSNSGSSNTGNSSSGNTSNSGSSNNSSSSESSESSGNNSSDSQGTSSSVSTLISVARSKVGSPYVWGAKGPNSFDCSGFIYWCLNQAGVNQSYLTSAGWRNVGKYQKVSSFSNIKAGDIVVVRGHVGIAAGNGMVIDASSSSGKIVYRDLGAWWSSNFIVAWRIY